MNKKLPLSFLLVFTSFISVSSMANTLAKPHSFGGHIASGGIEYKGSSADGDGIAQIYGFYNYGFTENFALEVGLNVGADMDDWDCYEDRHDEWHCSTVNNESLFSLGVDQVEYSNAVLAIKGLVPLSNRNSLYAKVGAQFYEYELTRRHHILFDDEGIGLYLAAGWQFEWDMGLGMSAGIERYNMGSLESTAVNIGMSYHF